MGTEPLYRHALAAIAALLPTYLLRFSVFGIPTNALEVLIVGIVIVGAIQPSVRRSWLEAIKKLPPLAIFFTGAFLLAAAISTFISPHLLTSLGILKGWIVLPLLYAFLIYAEAARIPYKATHYSLLATNYLILSGTVVALLGISQLGTLDRIRSVYDVPNSLALFLAPLIVLAITSSWSGHKLLIIPPWAGLRQRAVANYKLYSSFAAVMFIALLGTQSLAGILSVVAVLLLFWLSSKNNALRVTRYGLRALIFLAILLGLTTYTVVQKSDYLLQPNSSAHVRLQLWDISWELIQENPILGIGLGTFEPAYQQKLHQRFGEFANCDIGNSLKIENCKLKIKNKPLPEFVFRDPHNWVLSFWLNTGLLGLLSFAGLHAWLFYRSYKLAPWPRSGFTGLQTFFYLLPLAVLLLAGLVDTIFWKNDLAVLHFMLLALLLQGPVGSTNHSACY